MSERAVLEQLVWDNPCDKLLLSVLADWLQEHEGMGRAAALRCVLERVRAKRSQVAMPQAAQALRPGSGWRFFLYDEILTHLKLPTSGDVTVVLVAGRYPPKATGKRRARGRFATVKYTATVGARWVLRKLSELEADGVDPTPHQSPYFDKY